MEQEIHFRRGPLDGTMQIFESEAQFKLNKIVIPYVKPISEYEEKDFYRLEPQFQYWKYSPDVEGSRVWVGKLQGE